MKVGLIGDPVAHSRSPRMQNAAFAALGMPHTYELWYTTLADLPGRVASLHATEIAGANVTVPHKQAVLPLLDSVSSVAQRIGAVNTIIAHGDALIGDNTDAYGYAASIREEYPDSALDGAVVLGAGGAARAVVVALQEMGVPHVTIVNRTLARAEKLADDLGADAAPWESLPELLPSVDILTNATSLGWHDERVLPTEALSLLPANALVNDLTYAKTPLLQDAAAHNLHTLDGLGMLVHQGVRSFDLWFGVSPPVDVMRAAAQSS